MERLPKNPNEKVSAHEAGHDHQQHDDHRTHQPVEAPEEHEHGYHHEHMESAPKIPSEKASTHEAGHNHQQHDEHRDHHQEMAADYKKRFIISLILTIPILLLSPMIQMFAGVDFRFAGDSYLLTAFSTALFFYGGKPFLKGAAEEIKKKAPAMMTLITLAITVAYVYSTLTLFLLKGNDFYWELATLIVIMLLGHWIEMKSIQRASKALDELVKLLPDTGHLITADGEIKELQIEKLMLGDKLLIKPGEKIPIDGVVYEGRSTVNESMMTGESIPVIKEIRDEVIGGTINGEGILKVEVSRTGEATFLSQMIRIVKETQASKSNTQKLADRAATWLFYIAIITGTVTFIVWLILGKDLSFIMERTVTVVVISCPHALGLAAPLVTAVSTSIGARKGLLIRDRAAFEQARKVNMMAFDKTGTLTKGEFGVAALRVAAGTEEQLLQLAYSLEYHSEHPIARGIVAEAEKRNLERLEISNFENLTGEGLKAIIQGRDIRIVSQRYMQTEHIGYDQGDYQELAKPGLSVVFVLDGNRILGMIALSDIIRESAKEALNTLKNMGVETVMMTGDYEDAARPIGEKVGIDIVLAGVLPQEKASIIEGYQGQGKIIAMTGDGVNDAPSLAQADLGIAIGAGTDVAIETADIVLVRSDLMDVVNILKLSKATYRKMVQNLVWATAYNLAAIPLAAGLLYNQGILISPALGAVLMSLSTIIVAVNARLLKID